MSILTFFRRTPEQIVEDYTEAAPETHMVLRGRHFGLLERAKVQGLDPNTILLLIQLFGPLAVALVNALVAWLGRRKATPPAPASD